MKLLKIKLENLLMLLYIPTSLANIIKSNKDFILLALIIHSLLIIGLYYGTKTTRLEIIKDIQEQRYKDTIEGLDELIEAYRRIKNFITARLENIKKEVIGSKLKTTKLKDAF